MLKFVSKKIKIGYALAFSMLFGALVYFLGHYIAIKKFDRIISYNSEKHALYSRISDIDYLIKNEYVGDFFQDDLISGSCLGYVEALNDSSCKYFNPEEYKNYLDKLEEEEINSEPIFFTIIKENDKHAYFQIRLLTNSMSEIFIKKFDEFKNEGIKNFILDIRGTSGKRFDPIEKILKHLCPEKELIFEIDKKRNKNCVLKGEFNNSENTNISLLIDEETSGTIIALAFALNKFCSAKIIGETTYEKAVKTKDVKLENGDILILPVSKFVVDEDKDLLTPDIECKTEEKIAIDGTEVKYDNDLVIKSAIKLLS